MMPTWSEQEPINMEQKAQAFVYRPAPSSPVNGAGNAAAGAASTLEGLWGPSAGGWMPGQFTEEEIRAREKKAWEQGVQEGEKRPRPEVEAGLARERQALAEALRQFARQREEYFQRVEAEAVKLALSIARKILHREAQVDPLLLAGVVRVALDKVSAGTSVRLRVHPGQVSLWQDYFARQESLLAAPELIGDASLELGHCLLETTLGATDLGLETQLKEVEQGFFDLLAQRPSQP